MVLPARNVNIERAYAQRRVRVNSGNFERLGLNECLLTVPAMQLLRRYQRVLIRQPARCKV